MSLPSRPQCLALDLRSVGATAERARGRAWRESPAVSARQCSQHAHVRRTDVTICPLLAESCCTVDVLVFDAADAADVLTCPRGRLITYGGCRQYATLDS